MDAKTVLHFAVDEQVKFVDMRFTDLPGSWHHLTFPINAFSESTFEEGLGFGVEPARLGVDQRVRHADDAGPDAVLDRSVLRGATLCLFANIVDPLTKEGYGLDPRAIARRAEAYLNFTGIADTAFFGPEAEFFVFDKVSYHNHPHSSGYSFDAAEGHWNSGRDDDNLGYRIRQKEGYVPLPPVDQLHDLRSDITQNLQDVGIEPECHHHEVASGGQCEIDFRFSSMMSCADNVLLFKYIVKNTAFYYGKAATFMPKPMFGDNGTGMHVHQSLWKNGEPLFAGDKYAGLSEMALHYIGGILKHAPALAALTSPTTNSYRRLVPGYEAPTRLAYSRRNRSAACRIPMYSQSPKAKRVEVRFPDPSCNPYLAFSAMLLAGLDGIQNRIDPGEPLDKDIYDMSPEQLANVRELPATLDRALEALEADHEFLLKGDVFTTRVIERWIEYKREKEVDAVRLRPTPLEFAMYFDV